MGRFNGEWVCSRDENFDVFLKKLGVGMIARGMAKTLTTTLNIQSADGQKFIVKSTTGPKTREVTFEIGKEIQESSTLGKPMKGTWNLEGDDMVGVFMSVDGCGDAITIKRTIQNDQLIQKMQIGSTECTRYFNKK
ncbi:fatty acid-binding protein, intestinal-like [Styela clava]